MNDAIRAIITSLQEHIDQDFLRREFLAVTNKFDSGWQYKEELSDLLDDNTSLDVIVERIVMPVLLTYASDVVGRYDEVCDAYEADLIEEARNAMAELSSKLQ